MSLLPWISKSTTVANTVQGVANLSKTTAVNPDDDWKSFRRVDWGPNVERQAVFAGAVGPDQELRFPCASTPRRIRLRTRRTPERRVQIPEGLLRQGREPPTVSDRRFGVGDAVEMRDRWCRCIREAIHYAVLRLNRGAGQRIDILDDEIAQRRDGGQGVRGPELHDGGGVAPQELKCRLHRCCCS